MKTYPLTIQANQRPETLERLLRVIRHRGFTIIRLQSEQHGNTLSLHATVQSERALSLLTHQLVKLPDVLSVA